MSKDIEKSEKKVTEPSEPEKDSAKSCCFVVDPCCYVDPCGCTPRYTSCCC